MGWVSQTSYIYVWGNGGKPGGPTPPPDTGRSAPAPAPVVEEDKTDKE